MGRGIRRRVQRAHGAPRPQGQLSTCHWVGDDGTRHWEQIYKMLPKAAFGARAYPKDAAPASTDLILAVFATLTFG